MHYSKTIKGPEKLLYGPAILQRTRGSHTKQNTTELLLRTVWAFALNMSNFGRKRVHCKFPDAYVWKGLCGSVLAPSKV